MPLLSTTQQHKIVSHIRRSFSAMDGMVAEAIHAASLLDRLDKGLLAKAFGGELTPHNRAELDRVVA